MTIRSMAVFFALVTGCAWGADPFLKIDVNAGVQGGATQDGWSNFGWSVVNVAGPVTNRYYTTSSAVAGKNVDVVIAAGSSEEDTSTLTARDRTGAQVIGSGFPLADLYRDLLNPNNNVPVWIKILGLKPGAAYEFKAYGYDDNNTSTVTVSPMADGSPVGISGALSYTAGTVFSAETDPDLCAAAVTAVSDEEGTLTFRLTGNPKPPVLGGFTLAKSDHDVFSLFIDFGDNSSSKVAAGAQLFYYTESTEPRSVSYAGQLHNGSTGRVTITLTQGTGFESKKFIVRDRNPTAYADVFPGYQEYRDCAILSYATSMWVDIDGLLPNAKYDLVVCPYDYNNGRTSTLTDWTSGSAGSTQTFKTTSKTALTADTPLDLYTASFRLFSDENGRIRLLNSVASGEVALAWLKIQYVPQVRGLQMIVF